MLKVQIEIGGVSILRLLLITLRERVWAIQIARSLPLRLEEYSMCRIESDIAIRDMMFREHYKADVSRETFR